MAMTANEFNVSSLHGDANRIEPTGTPAAPAAASAAHAAAETAASGSKGVESVKRAGESLSQGGAALWNAVKEIAVGSKDKTKGALGGIAGFAKSIGDNALKIVGGIGNTAGKAAHNFPKITLVTGVIAAGLAVRSFFKSRGKQQELEGLQKANELAETTRTNEMAEAQLKGKAQFDNPDAKADFVKKYGDRAASASQQSMRA